MTQPQQPEWDQLFVGRDSELLWLKRLWTDVKSGEARFCILRGESGFGKTKLIQKFYSDISSSTLDDPGHYWPNTLLKEQNNLRINPKAEEFTGIADIPWLWWGLRWTNPEERNQNETIPCGALTALNYLKPHQEALKTHEERNQRLKKVVVEGAALAADLASLGIVSQLKALYEFGKMGLEERQINQDRELSIQARQAKAIAQQIEQLLDFFGICWTANKAAFPLPVVIVLDDAQWIDTDSLNFIRSLLLNAIERHWPLLVVATHWEQEWNLAEQAELADRLPILYQQIATTNPETCSIRNIDRMEGLLALVNAALPGLPEEQASFILDRADGNPRLLHEIILELQGEPYYFEQQDTQKALMTDGLKELQGKSFALHDVQTRRFRRLHQNLQTLLSYASFQGMRFIKDLVLELAAALDKKQQPTDNAQTLAEAIHPYATVIESSAVIYEFRHRVFYDLAKTRIDKFPTLAANVEETLLGIGQAWHQEHRHQNLPNEERESYYLLMLKITDGRQDVRAFEQRVLIELLLIYHQQGYVANAEPWLEKLENCLSDSANDKPLNLPYWDHYTLILLIKELNCK